jgi:hypothetical protein
MRSKIVFGVLAIAFTVALTMYWTNRIEASTGPIPLNCNRACMEGVVNTYLTALVAKDPKQLPLSADVKFTENGQTLQIGDGFWKTVEGRGNYTHIFSDPEFGQVAYMGTMREAGQPLLMSLRLRLELGRITEIEHVFFRPGGGGPNNIADMDKPYVPEQMWFKSIPPAQRMSRQELIGVADGYFTSVQKNDGKGINGTGTYPFTNDCHRIENGAPTTNVQPNPTPAPAAGPRATGQAAGTPNPPAPQRGARGGDVAAAPPPNQPNINANAMDCLSQFKLGYYFIVTSIHGRRYPVVDQERGIVYAHSVFDQGTVNTGVLSDGTPWTFRGFNRPSSILVTEAFLIEGGKIRRVEMVGTTAFYHFQSPWGGLSGN